MCIILYSLAEPGYDLILAANRDEFLSRPTTDAAFHAFSPTSIVSFPTNVSRYLSGLDLSGGGTWLGVSLPSSDATDGVQLRFATLTNYTESLPPSAIIRPSRGVLVRAYLASSGPLEEYLRRIDETKADYVGFNLLVGELKDGAFRMSYATNRSGSGDLPRILEKGIGGMSNSTIDELWPKVEEGVSAFGAALASSRVPIDDRGNSEMDCTTLVDKLWRVMSTPSPSPISHRTHLQHTILVQPIFLDPSTIIPAASPPFPPPAGSDCPSPGPHDPTVVVGGSWYATRVQTIVSIRGGVLDFRERDAYVLKEGEPMWSGNERRYLVNLAGKALQ